ncbi:MULTISPECIES: DUF883 family protein [unclassified Yoonia]|uniref:DUF883 family protein n=1 Tax=unclassified Yoonia TaxID=2629118 RepID=UPI002AFE5B26|nr:MULTISPECIES: hypothetical protein [unclassified Yoonia]
MAQVKAVNETPQDNIDQLSSQIATLRNDIAAISKSLADLSVNSKDAAVQKARQTAAELRASGEEQLHNAQIRAEELGQQAVDAVRKQPATAVGLAVGVGFLLGFLSGRK